MNKLLFQANELASGQMDTPSYAFPIEPRPGEGIPDLLLRATSENGFHSMRVVSLMLGCAENISWSHSALTSRPVDAVAIATVLGLESDRIQEMLYGSHPGPINFFGARISSFYLGRARRIAPTHLKQKEYQKAVWGLRCFSFDPESREKLVDRCPCGLPLTFERSAALNFCTGCGADLREIRSSNVDIADERALDFILSLIDPCADRSRQWDIDEALRQFSRGELFTLVVESAKLLHLHMTGWKNTKKSSYTIPHNFLIDAADRVLNWPNGFFEMAILIQESRPTSGTRQMAHALVESIPHHFTDLIWFLRKELNLLFGRGPRVRFRYPTTTMTQVEQPPLSYPKSVKSQAKLIGLPICEVLNLYQGGSIQCPDRSLGLLLGAPATAPSLNLESIKKNVVIDAKARPVIDLVQACRSSKHPWALVFGAILNGDIKVTWRPSREKSSCFSKCLFTTDEVNVKKICQLQESTLSPDTEISPDDLLFYLRMCRRSRAILRGIGVIPRDRLTLGFIWELQTRYMTFQDIRSHFLVAGMNQFPTFLGHAIDKFGLRKIVPEVRIYARDEAEEFLTEFLPSVRDLHREEST
ncbi:hypothetical protein HFO27_26425 [Rhizobium leguminosarum]|uniref:hypothetical protein n=1 Tax=Rhizobium leguminosarum TaxID=384 RepID=UPI001C903CBF|nr:hypothetical protein [Rhizobium leguminosarum]MBY3178132.1 hypothetical protein [Rhizobium leguminosarum]